ncbi:MAG: Ig-like domain-containing protein [bacterium]
MKFLKPSLGLFVLLASTIFAAPVFAVAPQGTNLSAAETYTEDVSLNLIDIVASDIDSANVTATLTLSSTTVGTLSTATSGAATSIYNAGTGVWTASGAIANVNALLAGVTFIPTPNGNSGFTIATSISDGVDSVTGTKVVNGVAINDAPVLDNSRSPVFSSVNQDSSAPSGAVGTSVSMLIDSASIPGGLDNVTDVDSGAVFGIAVTGINATNLTCYYSINSGTTWTAFGSVSNTSVRLLAASPTSRIYCQPSALFFGTVSDAITFRAWDQTSGTNGGSASAASNGGSTAFSTATDTASIVVAASSNTAPVAVDDAYTIDEDTGTPLSVLINDTDVDNDTLIVSAVTTPNHGTAIITSGGTRVSYTPDANFDGIDIFDYTISDGNGRTATGTVRVTVAPINDAPVANDDSYTLAENSSATAFNVTTNDEDVDGDIVAVVFVGSPDHGGSASIQGNDILYTPAGDFFGTETFSYTITDGFGGTDSGAVSIDVTSTDVTAPDTFILSKTSPSIDSSTATFEFESNEDPATFECAIDTGGGPVFTSCTSPFSSSLFSSGNTYTFLVRAIDASGNVDASPAQVTWAVSNAVVQEVSPANNATEVSITSPIVFTFTNPVSVELRDGLIISSGPCASSCPVLVGAWNDDYTILTYTKDDGAFDYSTTYTVELALNNGITTGALYQGAFTTVAQVVVTGGSSSGRGTPWDPITQSVAVTNTKTPYRFPRTLRQGLKGDDVVVLQKFLNIVPVPSKYFGLKTRAALIAYQVSHGLVGDGILGPKSRTVIETELNK